MRSDLRYANLNCSNIENANLLGIKWKGCKIENLTLGKKLKQENNAKDLTKTNQVSKTLDSFEQAE
jgi:uncharacterized protein YjbI with pentapeptide repeats